MVSGIGVGRREGKEGYGKWSWFSPVSPLSVGRVKPSGSWCSASASFACQRVRLCEGARALKWWWVENA